MVFRKDRSFLTFSRRSDMLAFVFFLFAIYVLMLFLIDTAFSAIVNSGLLYNGFFKADPIQMYHIGVWSQAFIMFILCLIIIQQVVPDRKKEGKN